jgi:hypothetical protein
MKMQDEDLDELFNAKLKGLEVEPSAVVWDKIAPAISGDGNKKKSLAIYWQIAASVVVLLTAGLLFRPSPEKIALHGQYNGHEVAVVKPVQPATDEFDSSTTHTADALYHQTAVNSSAIHHDKAPEVNNNISQDMTSYRDSIQHLAVVKPENIVKPERQDQIINTTAPVNTIADVTTPKENTTKPLAIAAIPEQKNSEIKKKKKIHTLGDLFNVVIAKVDKRENKVIEFSDDDDDDAFTISGVNLGPLKVKKQN